MKPLSRRESLKRIPATFTVDLRLLRLSRSRPLLRPSIGFLLLLLALTALLPVARAATYTVTNLNDSGPGSLRQAVADANASAGADTITFQSGLSGTITLTSGEIAITEALTINGPGAGTLAVSGNHASRIFAVSGGNLTLAGLALVNGDTGTSEGDPNPDTYGNGGAIKATNSAVTATDCAFTGNSANYGYGGAIEASLLAPTNCTFTGNSAGPYGSGGGASYGGDLVAANCTFIGNISKGNTGGAMFAYGSVTATNCTFADNRAMGNSGTDAFTGGGAIFVPNNNSVTATNCVLWGNTSATVGAQISIYSGTVTISHSDVQGGLAGIFLGTASATLMDAGGNLATDPLFMNAAAGDLHLPAGSPCIDTGDNNAPGLAGTSMDLDGNPRFVGPAVDMGAFEFQSIAPGLVAVDDSASVQGFHLLTIPVLTNDLVPPGSSIAITAVSRASHGAVSIGPNGTTRYRPVPGFTGTDQFTYTIGDGQGHTATARVTVTVT
jgi:hypothetical protein